MRFLFHLHAEICARCFLQLLDKNSEGTIADIGFCAKLAARGGKVSDARIPRSRFREASDFEREVGKLFQCVPPESVGTLGIKALLGGAEESIRVLHVAALKTELPSTQDGHSDCTMRIPRFPGQSVDPSNLGGGLVEAAQLSKNAVQGRVRPDLPGGIAASCEDCDRAVVRLFSASRLSPAQISQIKEEPGMVRMPCDQLFEPAFRLPRQTAVAAGIGKALGGLF